MKENTVKFQPFGKNILVIAPKIEKTTKSGIYKGDAIIEEETKNQQKNIYLEVAAIGDEVTRVKLGDRVLISGGSPSGIELDGVIYLITHEGVIAGKLID